MTSVSCSSKASCSNKDRIIQRFIEYVKGKCFIKSTTAKNHAEEGHWLEKQMGILPNSKNEPDNMGYEQKKSSAKISFGDWSASDYIYKNKINNMSRSEFLKTFGSPNPKKDNRYSWSGKVFPKYGTAFNYAGQRIIFNKDDDLIIEYSYNHDSRDTRLAFDNCLKLDEPIQLAIWKKSKLEKHINSKFGVKGFYICKKNTKDGTYDKICFGNTIDFPYFKKGLENGTIILDSGMYEGNPRQYSQFRASSNMWDSLITEEY